MVFRAAEEFPAVRVRSVVGLVRGATGRPYPGNAESRKELPTGWISWPTPRTSRHRTTTPLVVLSGELDFPVSRTDAAQLVGALRERYAQPDQVRLTTVPHLAHPLAEPPGLQPAPQLPTAKAVDAVVPGAIWRCAARWPGTHPDHLP